MPPKIFFGSTLARSTSVFCDSWLTQDGFLQLCQHARPNMVFPVPTQKMRPAIWHWSLGIVRRLRRKRRLKLGKLREEERLRERRGRKACD